MHRYLRARTANSSVRPRQPSVTCSFFGTSVCKPIVMTPRPPEGPMSQQTSPQRANPTVPWTFPLKDNLVVVRRPQQSRHTVHNALKRVEQQQTSRKPLPINEIKMDSHTSPPTVVGSVNAPRTLPGDWDESVLRTLLQKLQVMLMLSSTPRTDVADTWRV